MAGALGLYLLVVAGVFVAIVAAMVYYDRSAAMRETRRKYGLSPRGMAWAIALSTLAVAVLLVLGSMPFDGSIPGRGEVRRVGYAVVLYSIPLYLGTLALAAARGNLPTYRRLRRTDATPAADVTPGVASVSGLAAVHETSTATPFTDAEALCYRWRVEAYDPHGVEGLAGTNNLWETTHLGTGGVPFAVEDDSGSVLVDPDGASLSLPSQASVTVGEDESVPSRLRRELDSTLSGTEFRFEESFLRPGTEVSVFGTAIERDGYLVLTDGGQTPFVVSHGPPDAMCARYRRRVVGFLLAGLLLVPFGLWLLLGVTGFG